MVISSCTICQSTLRAEIEGADSRLRPDKVIQWARQKGVNISRFSLAKHRANHIALKSESKPAQTSPQNPTNIIELPTEQTKSETPATPQKPQTLSVSDQHFLDTVRDMVFHKLLDGEIELKLDAAFKAIEIKHKIAEESQNERLLLEILNEIRSEELHKVRPE